MVIFRKKYRHAVQGLLEEIENLYEQKFKIDDLDNVDVFIFKCEVIELVKKWFAVEEDENDI